MTNRKVEKDKQVPKRKVQLSIKYQNAVDWKACDAELVLEAITRCSFEGGALRFGYTRDGGAYAVGVMGDGEPYTLYATNTEELENLLKAIINGFTL